MAFIFFLHSGRSPRHYVPRDNGFCHRHCERSAPRHCEAVKPRQSFFCAVRCIITAVDPHVTTFLGMTVVVIVIARGLLLVIARLLSRGNLHLCFVIARVVRPVATLRLSQGQNQTCLNYALAEQWRPKVNLHLCRSLHHHSGRSPRRSTPRDDGLFILKRTFFLPT